MYHERKRNLAASRVGVKTNEQRKMRMAGRQQPTPICFAHHRKNPPSKHQKQRAVRSIYEVSSYLTRSRSLRTGSITE